MDGKRLAIGFGWGVVATLAMTVVMIIGRVTGVAPMPEVIPVAVAGHVLGAGTPRPLVMVVGVLSHLFYGGFWGAVLAALIRPVTVWKGLGLGVLLWLGMQLVFLPFLGWGLFGTAITPLIAVATLVLHLVYGGTLGWLLDREQPVPQSREAGRSAVGTHSR